MLQTFHEMGTDNSQEGSLILQAQVLWVFYLGVHGNMAYSSSHLSIDNCNLHYLFHRIPRMMIEQDK